MATNMFLKIEGPDVKGDSVVDGHIDEIYVYGWSWGMTQSGSMHTGTGGGTGKVSVQDLHITKQVDKASPTLMGLCSSGQHFDKATVSVLKAGGDNPVQYLTIAMQDVIISSYSTGGAGGDDTVHESLSLNFAKYKVTFVPQDAKGVALASVEHAWDVALNKKW